MRDVFQRWLDAKVDAGLGRPSQRAYTSSIRRKLAPQWGHVEAGSMTSGLVTAGMAALAEDGCSGQTMNVTRAMLSMACGWATTQGMMGGNPVIGTAQTQTLRQPMSDEDIAQLRRDMRGLAFEELVVFTLDTGLRRGELCALRMQDVRADYRSVDISTTVTQRAGGEGVSNRTPVAQTSLRTLPVPAATAEMLRQMIERRGACQPGDAFWPSRSGRVWAPNVLTVLVSQALQAAGWSNCSLVDLRHAYAARQIRAGVAKHTISYRMGHGTRQETQRLYREVFAAHQM